MRSAAENARRASRRYDSFYRRLIQSDIPVFTVEIVGPGHNVETVQVRGNIQRCLFIVTPDASQETTKQCVSMGLGFRLGQ
jgi:hypothetical protein